MQRIIAITALLVLGLTACGGATKAERNEAAFLGDARQQVPDEAALYDDAGLLEVGDILCDLARESGDTPGEVASRAADMTFAQGGSAESTLLFIGISVSAEQFLCSELA